MDRSIIILSLCSIGAGTLAFLAWRQNKNLAESTKTSFDRVAQSLERLNDNIRAISNNGSTAQSEVVSKQVNPTMGLWSTEKVLSRIQEKLEQHAVAKDQINLVLGKFKDLNGEQVLDLVVDEAHGLSLNDKLFFMGIPADVCRPLCTCLEELANE